MTIKLSDEERISLHRELWLWCSENPDKDKTDWPKWRHNGGKYPMDDLKTAHAACFLCGKSCCLLEWPGNHCFGIKDEVNGLYSQWFRLNGKKSKLAERAELALQIAQLPERSPDEVITTDGFKLQRQPDGSYSDGDISFYGYYDLVEGGHV